MAIQPLMNRNSTLRRLIRNLFLPGIFCLRSASCGGEARLELTAPLDCQVVQRSAKETGKVTVAGTLSAAEAVPDRLEARVDAGAGKGMWQKLAVTFTGAAFAAEMELPAGGWYRLELRASRNDVVLAGAVVEHLGVGEVFVVAGQSNSANHGAEKQSPKTGKVAAFDGKRWQLANDPQPGASGGGGSFLPPLGDALVERWSVPVGFIACGIGATSVREWLPKGATFPNPPTITGRVAQRPDGTWESKGEAWDMLLARMKQAGPHGFRAVLWHQGESDANQADATRTLAGNLYREYLEKVIRETRRGIGWDAPWFVAQVSYHVPGDEASPDIRAAQASLWKDGIALEGPDSDSLKGELREGGGKGVHFSGPGLRAHAALWAQKIIPWVDQQLAMELPPGLVLDLDADHGVTVADGDRVTLWQNQVTGFVAREFVSRDEGRKEPGSGRPALRKAVSELRGHGALVFRQQELVCLDEDAFDSLTQGNGCTWLAVLAAHEQRVGLKDVNSFFGNLKNSDNFEGLWGCLSDDNTVWWGPRNGLTFGRFDVNNPQLSGRKLEIGRFSLLAGRMAAGTGKVKVELFVNGGPAVAASEVQVNPKANPSRMAIGQERDAINHPGHESFDGEIARFLIFARSLDDAELSAMRTSLLTRYGIK